MGYYYYIGSCRNVGAGEKCLFNYKVLKKPGGNYSWTKLDGLVKINYYEHLAAGLGMWIITQDFMCRP